MLCKEKKKQRKRKQEKMKENERRGDREVRASGME